MWIDAAFVLVCSSKRREKPKRQDFLITGRSVPTLIYDYELSVMTERTNLHVQETEMSFFCRVTGLYFKDRERSSAIQEGLGALSHQESSYHYISIPLRAGGAQGRWSEPLSSTVAPSNQTLIT